VSPTTYTEPQPPRSPLLTALVAGAIIALVAANIYLYIQIDHLQTDLAKLDQSVKTGLTNLRDASSVNTAAQQRHLETLKEELEAARTSLHDQARTMSAQAKAEATARAEQLARQIEAEQAKVQQQVSSEISDVKQSATVANSKIADVSTDVGNVKTQVSATQAELQKTIADLKSVTGDLGVQSGLVATNGKELAALRRLGERNYIDIKLGKTKQPQRFGDITLLLKNADVKKNRYSVQVMADDKLTLKENKNINEPVQFYTTKGGRLPYELVINQVGKNEIVGYLSTPKETIAR
jgi:chromosome segregation ATPase